MTTEHHPHSSRFRSSAAGDGFAAFPVFLRLEGRRVLLVGTGSIGKRKLEELLEAGALIRVVSLAIDEETRRLGKPGRVEWLERTFEEPDVEGAWLVVAATNDPVVNGRIARAAGDRHIFTCAVDDPARATAFFGSILRRAPFTVAISSNGQAPALTRLLREVIELVLPEDRWVEHARALRETWKAEKVPMADRFRQLVRRIADSSDT
jgi:siroheme synthase-like protein